MSYNDLFQVDATLVANEFLDKYMPSANGDYVKVYLFLLRNRVNGVDVETIAEHLELTEGDVRRAISYWEKCGIVSVGAGSAEASRAGETAQTSGAESVNAASDTAVSADEEAQTAEKEKTASQDVKNETASGVDDNGEIRSRYRRTDGKEALNRLAEDDEFRQLLFMAQTYRSKILNEQEEQVLAYLYDGLHLPVEVLDYLIQYCVETNHNSMRYIEKTGLDWANIGIKTVNAAKRRTKEFDRIREAGTKKRTVKKDKTGITRENDLDQWLLNQVAKRNIQ